ncbi:MAG: hypothetical protein D6732_19890 [Methanobacteriota archaeon]|nr:MAG: hypothetical protein D6732_19890 [Euryarchaeota archaeon]
MTHHNSFSYLILCKDDKEYREWDKENEEAEDYCQFWSGKEITGFFLDDFLNKPNEIPERPSQPSVYVVCAMSKKAELFNWLKNIQDLRIFHHGGANYPANYGKIVDLFLEDFSEIGFDRENCPEVMNFSKGGGWPWCKGYLKGTPEGSFARAWQAWKELVNNGDDKQDKFNEVLGALDKAWNEADYYFDCG